MKKITFNKPSGFPKSINLKDPKYKKLRRWITTQYAPYCEHLTCKKTVKSNPKEFGIQNYSSKTWGTSVMRGRVSEKAEELLISTTPSDELAVMPQIAADLFFTRTASYKVAKRHYFLHKCLRGVKKRNRASHVFLEVPGNDDTVEGRRDFLYEIWDQAMGSPYWNPVHLDEYWRYARIVAKTYNELIRVEIWYDSREYKQKLGLFNGSIDLEQNPYILGN